MCVMVYIRCLWSVYKAYMSVYRCNISGGQGEDAHGDVDADVSLFWSLAHSIYREVHLIGVYSVYIGL